MIVVDQLTKRFGQQTAVDALSFTIAAGQIVGLLGPNGAGKSTTLRMLSGIRNTSGGRVLFDGEDITRMPAHQRTTIGICQSPEGRGIFPGMTVLENLDMGAYARKDRKSAAFQQDLDRVFELFPRLAERRTQTGGSMSGGEQQMLAIARALVARPRLVLIDEPLEGLAPGIAERIEQTLQDLRGKMTVLLVDQNLKWLMQVADHHYVMDHGCIVFHGTSDALRQNPALIEQYLGVAA